jgi:spore coat polysaccharide biosynthesis protein SpsF (cytidylyltransferase family)
VSELRLYDASEGTGVRSTPDQPFTLATLEDDEVTRRLDRLADELTSRADVDAFGGELCNSRLINELADDIRDHLGEAILKFRTPAVVTAGFAERNGTRV